MIRNYESEEILEDFMELTSAVKSVDINLEGILVKQLEDKSQTTSALAFYSVNPFEFSFHCEHSSVVVN